LDLLLHHSTTVTIRGESYRLKERKKAGRLPTATAPLKLTKAGRGARAETFGREEAQERRFPTGEASGHPLRGGEDRQPWLSGVGNFNRRSGEIPIGVDNGKNLPSRTGGVSPDTVDG
jgi:hypothetical protein